MQLNQIFSFQTAITHEDGRNFSNLTGDTNPLHFDNDFAIKNNFKEPIVPGALSSSFFSTLIGVHAKSLYLSQKTQFRLPIYFLEPLTIKGTVIGHNQALNLYTMKTEIFSGDTLKVTGEALIKPL